MRRALEARRPRVGGEARVASPIARGAFRPPVPRLVGPYAGSPAVLLGRSGGQQINQRASCAGSGGGSRSPLLPDSGARWRRAPTWRADSGDAGRSANGRSRRWPNPHEPVSGEQCELLGGWLQ